MSQKLGDHFPEPAPVTRLMPYRDRFIVADYRSTGTYGGNTITGVNVHALSTVEKPMTGASLASNIMTLPAGVYDVEIDSVAYYTVDTKLRLVNNATSAILTESLWHRLNAHNAITVSHFCRLVLTESTAIRLELVCTAQTNGFGYALVIAPFSEVYARVCFNLVSNSAATVGQRVTQHFGSGEKFVSSYEFLSQYAVCEYSLSQGTPGGGVTGWVYTLIPLNTVVTDSIGVTLASGRITLPAGSYVLSGQCKVHRTNETRLVLRKYKADGSIWGTWLTPAVNALSSQDYQSNALLSDFSFYTTGQESFELLLLPAATRATDGMGLAKNEAGVAEIHARLTIIKVAPWVS